MQQLWTLVILGLGVVIAIYGFEVAWTNPGMYWELGYLPKKYPMLILPLTGSLVAPGRAGGIHRGLRALPSRHLQDFRGDRFGIGHGPGPSDRAP